MSRNNSGITREKISLFFFELNSKFWSGLLSSAGFLYISLMLGGVAWATWYIPSFNESETSPETFGIYAIGFLIPVMLDAMVIWKKSGSNNKYEEAIATIFMVFSFFFIFCAANLSLKTFHIEPAPDKTRVGEWKSFAMVWLSLIFICTIAMSLVLTGIDSKDPPIGALKKPLNEVQDR